MAFENDTNMGRVQKMVETLALIQKSALCNRATQNRDPAMADRVLASDLFLRLGELEDAHA